MKINLPWISSRIYLISFCIFDIILFFSLRNFFYNTVYFSSRVSSFLLLFLILIISYVIGRYVVERDRSNLFIFKSLSFKSLKFILIISLIILILSNGNLFNFNYKDQIIFLFSFIFLSSLLQYFTHLYIFNRNNNQKSWLFVGEKNLYNDLQFHIKESLAISKVDFLDVQFGKGVENKFLQNNYGLIIGNISKLTHQEKLNIYKIRSDGISVMTSLNWCINFLQSIPPNILITDDILRGSFFINSNLVSMRIKRLADFLVSIFLLIFFLPLLILSSIIIKIEDSGPILYSQLRTGYKGVPFKVWKLRTMIVGAETNGVQWAKSKDPRITFFGRFLRKMRIDELPQLVAVINGKMSLIGPRPERPEFDLILEKKIKHYKMRHLIKPGLSGWAQVNYPYGASIKDANMKLSFDLYYLKNFSNLIDILILFKTIRLIFNLKGSKPRNN